MVKFDSMKLGTNLFKIIVYIVLGIFTVFALLPIAIMAFTAIRPSDEITVSALSIPESITFVNFEKAWSVGKMNTYFVNSVLVIVPRVLGVLTLACLAGYGFAKYKFPLRNGLFFYLLFGMMIPFQAVMIPLYYNMQKMGMISTRWALILPAFGLSMPFSTFFMRSFFREVPDELINAARIDGAGEFRTFVNIIMPLTIPAVGSLLVFEFMWGWNDFLLPLLMIYKDSLRTLPLGLMYYKSKYTTNYSLAAAGVIITSLPIIIIYLIFQKNFIQGMTLGAVKG